MSAFNVVRMRAKPGRLDELLAYWRERPMHEGMTAITIVQTGERDICLIGQWTGMDVLVAARREMIAALDEHRNKLESMGRDLGVTDPVSGEALVERRA
jgi:hypothetical protein